VSTSAPSDLAARLAATDRVCLAYHAVLLAALAAGLACGRLSAGWGYAAGHVATIGGVFWLAAVDRPERRLVTLVRLWYPVLSLLWLYGEAGALRHLGVRTDLDLLVASWDALLIPGSLHLALPRHLAPLVLEGAHAVYLSYYLLLFVPGLVAMRGGRGRVADSIYVLNLCMLVHYLFGMLFPVSGPLAERLRVQPAGWLFIPLMNHLYAGFDRGGMAFPSTHAAVAVVAAAWAGRFFPRWRWAFWAWAAAIALATVACTYHYALDTTTGVLTGLAFTLALRPGAPLRAAKILANAPS